jgi:N-acetylneuraminic acid mutarotase
LEIEPESWQELPDMPVEKWEAATFVLDERLYVLGGYTKGVKTSRTAHFFDPADGSWTRIQDLPSAVSHVNPVLDGRVVWYAGGFKDGYKDHIVAEVWNYDVDLDGPVEKGRFTAAPLLPEKRGGGGLALFGRKLHYMSGLKEDRDTDAAEHWVMDLDEYAQGGGQWRAEAAPVPLPRNQFSTIQFDGKAYLIGGQFHHDSCQLDQAQVDIYDPATDSWSEGPPLPYGHSHSEGGTFVHQGKIYMVGGHFTPEDGRKRIDPDVLRLEPGGDWEVIGKLPVPLSSPAARIINGTFYVAGGSLDGGSVQPKMWAVDFD